MDLSASSKIRVAINGYGTIGKRVATAVRLQPDMELVGITAHSNSYRVQVAQKVLGTPIFGCNLRKKNADYEESYHHSTSEAIEDLERMLDLPFGQRRVATEKIVNRLNYLNQHLSTGDFSEDQKRFTENNIKLEGGLDDLLESCDVVIDCTPKPFGRINKAIYQVLGKKAIYQGGETDEVGDVSFVAQANYSSAVNKDHVRVVSCNTTGLVRILDAIHKKYRIELATVTLIRRGTDSNDHKRGPINAIIPSLESPSHHGPDVRSVLPELDVFSSAYVVPTTLMHVHDLQIDLVDNFDVEGVRQVLLKTRRIRVIPAASKMVSTAQILDFARDLEQNSRGDMMDICVWEKTLGQYDRHGHNKLFVKMAVHQESDVVPENIDAVRAVMGFTDAEASMNLTDETLNMNPGSGLYGFSAID